MKVDTRDLCQCSYCGTTEHIHLLDGVLTRAGNDTGKLACIACYPKGSGSSWCPLNTEHFALSVAPKLAPLYAAWLEEQR